MGQEFYPEVVPLRAASREMVRELGFMQTEYTPAGIPHTHCHALMEIERRGQLTQRELGEALHLEKSTISRMADSLLEKEWIKVTGQKGDGRANALLLTGAGRQALERIHQTASARVHSALMTLTEEERSEVLEGISLYAKALERSRSQDAYEIRPIQKKDNAAVAKIVRDVMTEFGANGAGFAYHDAEVDDMYAAYNRKGAAYFVIVHEGEVVGGGGVAPLAGGDGKTCELRKMYFLKKTRGAGLGQRILNLCLEAARAHGYKRMYLETLKSMGQARALYDKNGFERLSKPAGNTGHFSCDSWYQRRL